MRNGSLQRLLSVVRRQVDPDASGPLADERLLARFAATRDAGAFELLVWRHGAMVHGVCRRVLGDHHAAEDAFQATFLALSRKPNAVRTGAALPGWLHRVAHRIAVRARRDGAKRGERDRKAARPELVLSEFGSGELRVVIDEEIDRLPERMRRAVVLCYLEGVTTEHAARLLGCPRGTVLSRLAAARERLKTRFTRRGLALPACGFTALVVPAKAPAGLVPLAVNAILGGSASIPVIGLAQGVLNAMIVTKIKLATAAVLTTGMLGTGIGWVAGPGRGSGIVAQAQAADPRADNEVDKLRLEVAKQKELAERARAEADAALAKERAERESARKSRTDKVDAARRDVARAGLQAAEAKLEAAEKMLVVAKEEFDVQKDLRAKNATTGNDFRRAQAQLNQAMGARGEAQANIAVAKAELVYVEAQIAHASQGPADVGANERLSAMAERDELVARQNDWDQKRMQMTIEARLNVAAGEERLRSLDNEQTTEQQRSLQQTAAARTEIQKQKERRANLATQLGADHPQLKALDDEIKRSIEQIEVLQQEFKVTDDKRIKLRMMAREESIRAEEMFKLLERRLAGEESEWQIRRVENQQRLQKARGASTGSSSDQRLVDIERKLEALVRELSQWRKEMKQ